MPARLELTGARRAPSGVGDFLDGLRSQLKDRSFRPLPVRERMIPKAGGKLRPRLNMALRGWCAYFRPGVSSVTFGLSESLHVADGLALDAAQTPPVHMEGTPPPLLRRRMVARQREQGTVRSREGRHDPLPISRFDYSGSLARLGMRMSNTRSISGLVESPVH